LLTDGDAMMVLKKKRLLVDYGRGRRRWAMMKQVKRSHFFLSPGVSVQRVY
jgi:hypothetical protein